MLPEARLAFLASFGERGRAVMRKVSMSAISSRWVLAASLCAVAVPLAAQDTHGADEDASQPPALDLPLITVTGEGLEDTPASPAYATTSIGREQILAAPSGRIEEVLSAVAGFQQFRRSDSRAANPSAQGVTLRALGGNASSRALVLLDGVPMADPFFGFIPLSAIAPERLEEVRVTRGGGSGPFGAGALAGVIELTSAAAEEPGAVSGQFLANDRGGTEASARLGGGVGGGFASLTGRWDRDPGFFTTPSADRVDASARARFDSFSVQARGIAPLGETTELQARGLVYDDRRTLRFDGADSSSSGQDASLRIVGRGRWAFDALAYVQARDFTNVVVSSTRYVPVLDQRRTPSTGIGGKLEIRPPSGARNVLRLGVDYRRSEGELFETALSALTGRATERRNAGGTNANLGFFAEKDLVLGDLTVTGGVRADRYAITRGFFVARNAAGQALVDQTFADRSGWAGSFRGGVLFAPIDHLKLRAAAYSALRLPTLNELYRPFVVFPITTRANAALANERLFGVEAGADVTFVKSMTLSLTAFDNRVEGAIANVTLDERTRERQNIDRIAARGLEATMQVNTGALDLAASLAWTDAVARQGGAAFDGKRPAQTPAFAASASAAYRFGLRSFASLSLRHVGRQYEDDLESDALPAVTTLGGYAKIALEGRLALILRAENLFDERIVTRNQAGSIDYGTPRTFWGGLSLGF